MRLSKAPRRNLAKAARPALQCEALEPRQMLSADGLPFTPGVYDASMIRTAPAAPFVPESVFVNDDDLGVLSGDVTLPFVPYEDTFALHSNPTAPHTIYLDFDGHRTTGTAWNAILEDPLTGQDINSPPYDIDGDFGNFSNLELENIQEAFLRVAEDFAPFNVNVTTEEPEDLDDLRRTGHLDERWGIRVVSGGSSNDWLTPEEDDDPAGGVAFLFSFNDPIDTPAFAFLESGWFSGKNLAEVISHEAGHTLGLGHDGLLAQPGWDPDDPLDPRAPVEYFGGQGDWAPIMGNSYTAPVSQWSRGEYFMASNPQDDLAIITGEFNGIGYRADDQPGLLIGNTVVNGTVLEREPPTIESIFANSVVYKQEGIVEQNTDTDYYQFYSNQGPIVVDALPAAIGANLDIKIELLDSSGNVLATGSPDDDLTASLSATAFVPGFYTIAITGDASQETPQPVSPASTDYTDYGSLGQYSLTIAAALGPEPDAYEKNDFLGTAYEAPYADYTFRGSAHQGGDEDYYRWTAGQTGTLKTDLRFLHADGDLELEIYNQAGVRIPGAISASNTDNEFLEIDVVANQDYLVRVWAPGSVTQDSYELWLDGPGVPLDGFRSLDGSIDLESQFSTFEFDDPALRSELGPVESNDTPQEALVLKPGPSIGGGSLPDYDLDLSIHRPDDNDFLLWTSPGTGKLILDLGFDHDQANIDVEVRRANLDSDGVVVSSVPVADGIAESTTDDEQLIVDVTAGTAYLIRVYATPTAGTESPGDALYSLRLDGPEINFDAFELNNTLVLADDTLNGQVGITPNLSIHSEIDVDYFRWTAPETGDLRARAFFFHENGDLDLNLLDAEGNVVAVSTSLTDNESVTERVIAGRDYFVKVYGFEGATQGSYALDLAFAPAPLIPGDFDGNGFVDGLDRAIWAATFGATSESLPAGEATLRADGNDDGFVDSIDYTIWRDNQGSGRVPELASVITNVTKPGAASTALALGATLNASADAALASTSRVATSPVAPVGLAAGPPLSANAAAPLEETFNLSSNPDSNFTIYLDFDGHITSNPEWDSVLVGLMPDEGPPIRFGLPFATPPYDINGNDTAFSTQELLNIQEAYLRVAEDFAPFDVNVTTKRPLQADLENAGGDDTRWGVRVVIGGSTFDWYSWPSEGGAGGVALLNSFSSEYDTPAYAFMEGASGAAKNIAEVVSHEVGHTLGLEHDGNFVPIDPDEIDPEDPPTGPGVNEYYPGHENNLWGTIMGAAYGPQITQWSKGEYFLANRGEFALGQPNDAFQDDLEVLTTVNGFGYREDDHADDTALATALTADFSGTQYIGSGLIETNTDYDYFAFQAEAGTVVINAQPAEVGANLDIKLQVFDESGNQIAVAFPDFDQAASLEFVAPSVGVYYVSVTGDGFANDPDAFTLQTAGYTDYGSLGHYTLGVVTPPIDILPDPYEPNDTLDTPYDLFTGDYLLNNLSRNRTTDDDVFLWRASADGTLLVDLIFSHDEADLDLEVYRVLETGDRELVAAGLSQTNNESVSLQVTADTQYLILVDGYDDQTVDSYTLRIDGPGDSPDIYEVNNTPQTATTLVGPMLDQILSLHYAGDQDYLQWQSPADDTLRVEADFDPAMTDLKIQVIDPATMDVLADSTATASSTLVQLPATTGQVYLIRVYSDASDPNRQIGDYRLLLNGSPLTGDELEPNGPATPTVVTRNKILYEELSIHTQTDVDVFEFTAPSTGVWRVTANFLHAFGDLDMTLSDSQGLIAEATTATNNETIATRLRSGETYTLQVYGYQDSLVGSYSLDTLFTPIPPLPGDFNDNGVVGRLDRVLWAMSYGETGTDLAADANEDGVVDAADYTIFRDNEGTTSIASGSEFHALPTRAAIEAGSNRSGYAPLVADLAFEQAVGEGERVSPTIAPAIVTRRVSTPRGEAFVAPAPFVSDRDLLLVDEQTATQDEAHIETRSEEPEEASRDAAFADLSAAFDRLG